MKTLYLKAIKTALLLAIEARGLSQPLRPMETPANPGNASKTEPQSLSQPSALPTTQEPIEDLRRRPGKERIAGKTSTAPLLPISPYAQTSQPDYSGTSQLSAAGKGCVPCGNDHISLATGALTEAIRFARTGDIAHPEVVSRITLAMDELNAFERIDGAPEKVTKLPPHEKKLMDDMMAASREIRHHITDIKTPEDLENTAALARQHRIEFMAKQIKMQKAEEPKVAIPKVGDLSPREKLVQELHALQDQRWEADKALTLFFEEWRQVRKSFTEKNPSAQFVGSPEWKQIREKERQVAHVLVEVEDKLKAVHLKLDALVSPAERKLESQMAKLEDTISDIEDKITDLEEAGKPTNILEEQKVKLEKQLDSLLAQLQELESKVATPKAEAVIPELQEKMPTPNPKSNPSVRGRKLLDANQVSDFDLRIDKVVRRGERTYIIDTSGFKADMEVASDTITPEIKANLEKLTPEQKSKMAIAIQGTPYLSPEGKAERLAMLREEA